MFTLIFNERDMAILNAALVGLPYRDVAPLIGSINRQIAEQQKLKEPAPSPQDAAEHG